MSGDKVYQGSPEEATKNATLDAKRAMIKAMEEAERTTMTLPTGSTVANFFPGNLRDWFAGQTMRELIRSWPDWSADKIANKSIRIADAMLAAREKQ